MKTNYERIMNQDKQLLLEPKDAVLPYDDPIRFAEALAQRHAQIIDEALSKWSKSLPKPTKPKSTRKTKSKPAADTSQAN